MPTAMPPTSCPPPASPRPRRRAARALALALAGLAGAAPARAQAPATPVTPVTPVTPAGPGAGPAAVVSGAIDAASFGALRWIEGTWRGRLPDGGWFHERYAFADDSTITVAHLADSTLARVTRTDTIALRRGAVRYGGARAVRVGADGAEFADAARPGGGFVFVRTGGGWTATIRGRDASGRPRELVYHMERAPGAATADREAVRRAVLDYVEGFYEGDTVRLARSVWPSVRKWGYARGAGGAYAGMAMAYPGGFMRFADGVRAGRNTPPPGAPKDVVLFDVQDQTASAKLTAWWGTDYLLLAREGGRWVITHVLWQSAPARGGARRSP